MSGAPGETPEKPAPVSDRDAIEALARVVNTGGDEAARQLLADYVTQGEDEKAQAAEKASTEDDSDDDSSSSDSTSSNLTRAQRRAAGQ